MTTIHFFAPEPGSELAARRDLRVTLVDHDEVTLTTKVDFADGFRAVVRDSEIISREA